MISYSHREIGGWLHTSKKSKKVGYFFMQLTQTLKKKLTLGFGATVMATSLALLGTSQINAATVTVKSGDTVSELAKTYHSTIATIEKENGIGANHLILVGQQLTIGPSTTTSQRVTVQAGDTVSGLADKYHSSIRAIESANHIVGHLILVGQVIAIPTTTNPSVVATTSTPAATPAATKKVTSTTSVAVEQNTATTTQSVSKSSTNSTAVVGGSEAAAKAIIAQRESGGSYTARNGRYIGKYQLTASYLNGDYSPVNQERVANQYVASRYGSWTKALAFWNTNGWY